MPNTGYNELTTERSNNNDRLLNNKQYVLNSRMFRIVFIIIVICGTAISFFYNNTQPQMDWNFENQSIPFKPQWTWSCQNEKCVRSQSSENTKVQSLKTCNMICEASPLWPKPTLLVNLSKTIIPVQAEGFNLQILASSSEDVTKHLIDAFELLKSDIQKPINNKNYKDLATARKVLVRVSVLNNEDPRMTLTTKEHYKLVLNPEGDLLVADIKAESFCGARHGFETLSQLIWFDTHTESLSSLETAIIKDAPRFPYRGLLLDTARNYFPVNDIMRTLDAMAAVKLNTFHWHATDSQSFPLKLNSVPQMASYGSYGEKAIYTTDDIKAVVQRARIRGIRVVIEIDAPAHIGRAWSWGPNAKLGDLAYCIEADPWVGLCGEPPCGQLNPSNHHVFQILEKMYAEIIELTGVDDVFHLGGDEVKDKCWLSNMPDIDPMDTWLIFTQNAKYALQKANKGKSPEITILWSSRLTLMPYQEILKSNNFTIQVWGGSENEQIISIPDNGLRSIMSHVNAWYLDCGFGSWRDTWNESCAPYRKWLEVYNHRPWSVHPDWRVEGGTACMWSEQLGPEGLDSRLWPRAGALGERLWSDPEITTADVYVRMDMQRERFIERGVGAEPIWQRWCTDNPYECL